MGINKQHIPLVLTAIFVVVFAVSTIAYYFVYSMPSETAVTWFQGELISVDQTEQGYLVTIDNSGGSEKYPGTQKCLIHGNTKVYDTEFDELAKGSTGMIVWIATEQFIKSDFEESQGDYIFVAKHFRIYQMTLPETQK